MIVILTGERCVGKSTVCQRTAERVRTRGLDCAGIITLRSSSDGLDVLDVRGGETRKLTVPSISPTDVIVGPYRFDAATVAWGNSLLHAAVPCDLLVVDELGPLEFERQQGWMAAFEVLRGVGYSLALVVVRPSLIERAQAALAVPVGRVTRVTLGSFDSLPKEIAALAVQAAATEI